MTNVGLTLEFLIFVICGGLLSTAFIIGARSGFGSKKASWEERYDRQLRNADIESKEREKLLNKKIDTSIPERPKKQSRYI